MENIDGLHSEESEHIVEVWANNLEVEFEKIRDVVEVNPFIALVRSLIKSSIRIIN